MSALRIPLLRLLFGLAMILPLSRLACGQAVSSLPRTEYYVARELLRVGRTVEAAEGFQQALNRARRVGEQRWIDSIPPHVMLGECYYQQGSLALALEQFDAALMLALANPGWIDQIEVPREALPDLDVSNKGINWFAKSRPRRPVSVPESVQFSIDPTQAQVGPDGVAIAPVSLITRLDATEVLRSMAIALMRRWQVLGPLAKHSPLVGPLDALFARNPLQSVPWISSSWIALRGMHGLSSVNGLDATDLLRQGTLIGDQFEYYMSPTTLLMLGKLEALEGNYQTAIVTLQDATLAAAQFEQLDTLGEATECLAACAAASQRIDLMDPLQRLAVWASKKSSYAQAAALAGAGELNIYSGNFAQAEKLLKQGAAVLRGLESALPRTQAQLAYTSAILGFGQNRGPLGISNLNSALKLMRGTALTGAAVESIFQAQMTLDLLAGGALTSADAEKILLETLDEPSRADWELTPLKTLAKLTTSSIPAFERLLELAVARGGTGDQVLQRMDRLQRQRLYEALPLGGRWFSWRNALAANPQLLPAEDRQVVEAAIQRFPTLASAAARIEVLIAQLRQAPPPLDERKISADDKRAFAELEDLAPSLENQLALQSLLRKPLSRYVPIAADLPRIQQLLGEHDILLALVPTSRQIFGAAITRQATHFWHSSDTDVVDKNLSALLVEIGLVRGTKIRLPSDVTDAGATWRQSAVDILAGLIPSEAQTLLAQSQRIVLAPAGRLWYVPYELLPGSARPGSQPWIAEHAVTYVPTLGSLHLAFNTPPLVEHTVGLVGSFFALDRDSNEQRASTLLQAIPNSQGVFLTQKVTVPSATWLKLSTDQLWVANELDNAGVGWNTSVFPFGNSRNAQIGAWLETPVGSPARVILPGLQTGMESGKLQNGNEIFLPVCAMLFSGTESACVSRWPTGGKSAATFLLRFLEELQDESPADALRRSVLAQWTEQFLIADEPALLPAGKEASALCSGAHPLLWSGYMAIGDYPIKP